MNELLNILLEELEFVTVEEMLEEVGTDSVVPGICTECLEIFDVEPDQDRGWCDFCHKNTVQSCLIIAEVI